MTDLYTKIMLTIVAAALCVNAFQNMNLVNPAYAAAGGVQRIAICDANGTTCMKLSRSGKLRIID